MFTRLDELKKGDSFYIKVMGETLGYKVDRVSVIEPSDVSKLRIVEDEDRVTLMTCTPYGVNTHRLLVSGLRAAIPAEVPDESQVIDRVRFLCPWWRPTCSRRCAYRCCSQEILIRGVIVRA